MAMLKPVCIGLPEDLIKRYKTLAKRKKLGYTVFMRQVLEKYMEKVTFDQQALDELSKVFEDIIFVTSK